ncbi:zinc-ribbon domain-containing protein [Virgibacillus sp. Bac330]|uniref:zinc-ribbon domain-containing protein n=1 Tax=Virgibacillus sp. Bac330 TaxID=2419841 RepID=UPI000EF44409
MDGIIPYCAGKRVNFTNCLSTTHPYLASEWDYNQNGDITLADVTKGSHDKVFWKCKKAIVILLMFIVERGEV